MVPFDPKLSVEVMYRRERGEGERLLAKVHANIFLYE
jgi:hypothetical protein